MLSFATICSIVRLGMNRRVKKVVKQLGRTVRKIRKERGFTAKEVAKRSTLSPRFYAQLEAGQANIAIGRLALVADALQVPLTSLIAVETPPEIIALLGLRGGGKSTLGPQLADKLGVEFVEIDTRVESKAGLGLTEIFNLQGDLYYRQLEAQCIQDLLDAQEPTVIALSGGVVRNQEAFDRIQRECITIWLKANPEDHMNRVMQQGDHRPMANNDNAMAQLRALLIDREPLYKQSHITINTSEMAVNDALSFSVNELNELGWSA